MRAPWLVLTLFLASCAATPPPPKGGPVGAWGLSEFRLDADQRPQAPTGAPFSLILDTAGHASGLAACNHWEGRYSTAGDRIFVEKVATGRERCLVQDPATAQLAQFFVARLESGARFRTDGEAMELRFADGLRWRFRRE